MFEQQFQRGFDLLPAMRLRLHDRVSDEPDRREGNFSRWRRPLPGFRLPPPECPHRTAPGPWLAGKAPNPQRTRKQFRKAPCGPRTEIRFRDRTLTGRANGALERSLRVLRALGTVAANELGSATEPGISSHPRAGQQTSPDRSQMRWRAVRQARQSAVQRSSRRPPRWPGP
jgi:hypothetical protein